MKPFVRLLSFASCLLVAASAARASGLVEAPAVGRFGLFAPPPLEQAPPPELGHQVCVDPIACQTPVCLNDFSAEAWFAPYEACQEQGIYNDKYEVPTQRPLIEWGVPFYGSGDLPVPSERFGATNLSSPRFYVYGDYRVGFAQNELVDEEKTVLAHRLNLELDLWLTSTERVHAFIGPFQEDARFMRLEDGEFFEELDLFQADTDTLFFEGDLGQIIGGFDGDYAPFDMPVTFGLVPLLFQNGVWALDAIVGGAVTIPAQNSPVLDWSNYDVTLFAGFDRVSSAALGFEEHAATVVGATTFIESRGGYFEIGYGYVSDNDHDAAGADRSYHNLGVSYTRRYANRVSNSLRMILNTGQESDVSRQTADGVLLLVENSLLTENPYNVIPYLNFFAGFDRPQPLVRAGAFGGVLFNSGILFQSDQLTGYPTLDGSGNNTYGFALGVDLLSPDFDQQLIVEMAALGVSSDQSDRTAAGDQAGLGLRWQRRLSEAHLIRADAMYGWLDNSDNIAGGRVEFRWKF